MQKGFSKIKRNIYVIYRRGPIFHNLSLSLEFRDDVHLEFSKYLLFFIL